MQPAPPLTDLPSRTRLISGNGVLARLGEVAAELGGKRVLLVTDRGIVAAGHVAQAVSFLEQAGMKVTVDDLVRENPSTADVTRCVGMARSAEADLLIGLGGGSSMDTAKGANFILTNGGEMKDYWGVGKATEPMLPLIAIPTTAGTGSECQSAALIADEVTHQKMACLDPKAAARVAILDPELTLSQPARVTACTGVDALAHALETLVTTKRTGTSHQYSSESFQLIHTSLALVLESPGDLAARGRMQLGAAYAGIAIENSMLGAAHSAANPLTAHHGVVHGQAVGLLLPGIIRFNAADPASHTLYLELATSVGLPSVEALAAWVGELLGQAGLRAPLTDFGVTPEGIPALAEEAARQWTATFNPRPITAADFAQLYTEVLR